MYIYYQILNKNIKIKESYGQLVPSEGSRKETSRNKKVMKIEGVGDDDPWNSDNQ